MKIVTAAIIQRQDQILLTRRKPGENQAGFWEFPGGKLEDHETIQACLERELQEELGVRSKAGDIIAESIHRYEHGQIKLLGIATELIDHKFNLTVHYRAEWVPINHLLNYHLAPADIPIARKVQEINANTYCPNENLEILP